MAKYVNCFETEGFKIVKVEPHYDDPEEGDVHITLENGEVKFIDNTVYRCTPVPGDYFVTWYDGVKSVEPKEKFEKTFKLKNVEVIANEMEAKIDQLKKEFDKHVALDIDFKIKVASMNSSLVDMYARLAGQVLEIKNDSVAQLIKGENINVCDGKVS